MRSTFSLLKGLSSEKRPGLDLFWWRSATFFLLYLIATVVFWSLRFHHISVWQWLITALFKIALLMVSVYHFSMGMMFKKLKYEVTDHALEIGLSTFNIKVPFSTIGGIKEASQETEIKKIFGYNKEAPQLIHFIGQIGKFKVSGIGNVIMCTALSALKSHEGLIIIRLKDGRNYGISPASPQDFIKIMQEKIEKVVK